MANNMVIRDGNNVLRTLKTTEATGSVHTPHHIVESISAGTAMIGKVVIRNSVNSSDIDPLAEAVFTARFGEVQATPTSNTLLGRLKDLLTGIILAAGANRIGKVTLRNSTDLADIDPLSESVFTARIGEVTASPTSNTILARLKDITTGTVLAAGANVVGDVGVVPRTSGGLSVYRNADLDETGVAVKASAGQVYGWNVVNLSGAPVYVKLYNQTAAPTVGTDLVFYTVQVPTSGNSVHSSDIGLTFSNGIGIGATTDAADSGTGSPGTGEVLAHLTYK